MQHRNDDEPQPESCWPCSRRRRIRELDSGHLAGGNVAALLSAPSLGVAARRRHIRCRGVPVGHMKRTRRLAVARAVSGGSLLAVSRSVPCERREMAVVAAALGVRHLVQSTLTLWRPAGFAARWASAADVAHGVSMLALAGVSAPVAACALADAVVAAAWAGATCTADRRDMRFPS